MIKASKKIHPQGEQQMYEYPEDSVNGIAICSKVD